MEFTKTSTGRPSGECYVEFATKEDQQKAMLKDHQHIGKRYVEAFEVQAEELDKVMQRKAVRERTRGKGFVRLKGLPFDCTKEGVEKFFEGRYRL